MTILGLGGRRRGARPPYGPYNAPYPAVTPTYDGSGQTIHPSVVDFGAVKWSGWRYWQANTPYPNWAESLENPSITVSDDGYTWVEPAGITNPIHPWSGIGGDYNSDVELVYDPDGDRLICYWRPFNYGRQDSSIMARTSPDGVTWSDPITVIGTAHILALLSPCVVRRALGDWWMFTVRRDSGNRGFMVYRSTDPLTGWDSGTFVTNGVSDPWHAGVLWDGATFRAAISRADKSAIIACSSTDGLAWTAGAVILAARPGEWDEELYRPSLTFSGTVLHCWYSAYATGRIARTGYTHIPLAAWPAPPA